MTDDVFDWPLFLRNLDKREHGWNQRRIDYQRTDAVPFLPYPSQLFAGLLLDVMAGLPGALAYNPVGQPRRVSFLDVGCGPGTKMALAHALFGLQVEGIDIVPEFIAEARDLGLQAMVCDAYEFPGYDQFDIVLVNRPSGMQDEFEPLIRDALKPGAVLIALNWRHDPGREWHWEMIVQEHGEPIRGAWIKPLGVAHLIRSHLPDAATLCCGLVVGELPDHDSMVFQRELVTCKLAAPVGAHEEVTPVDGAADVGEPVRGSLDLQHGGGTAEAG